MAAPRNHLARTAGFTLTELMIVVAILVALAALAIPAIQHLRVVSREIQCAQRLRAVGTAFLLYAGEQTDRKPAGMLYSFLGGSVPGEDTWTNQLFLRGYLMDKNSFRCPAVTPNTPITAANWYYESYGFNMVTQPNVSIGQNFYRDNYSGGVFYLPVSKVQEPGRLIVLADSRSATLSNNGHEIQRYRILKDGNNKSDAISLRHRNKANLFFLDGHVESADMERIRDLQNQPYAVVPFYDQNGEFHPQ